VLTLAGVHAVGNANNVKDGAATIRLSFKRLDELGMLHTEAGVNSTTARRPANKHLSDTEYMHYDAILPLCCFAYY
jgi:hypothetical protein